ncbi:MAG: V-type ATPase subunit [Methanoculleaceae archaeon]
MDDLAMMIEEIASHSGISGTVAVVAIFLIIILLLILIVVFLGYFTPLLTIALCAGPNARVRALGNPLVRCHILRDIAECGSLRDAVGRAREYVPWIDPAVESAAALERQLWEGYIEERRDFMLSVPDTVRPFFRACNMFCEIEMVIAALRLKHGGRPASEIRERVRPLVELTPELIDTMAEAADIDELVLELASTPYGEVLAGGLTEYGLIGGIEPLERRLMQFAFSRLNASRLAVGPFHTAEVNAYIEAVSAVYNIRTILRGIADGRRKEEIQNALVTGPPSLPGEVLDRMAEASGGAMIADILKDTPYGSVLEEGLREYTRTGSLVLCERALDHYLLETAFKLDVMYAHTAGPLIRYMVARSFEIRNLRGIFWSVSAGVQDRLAGSVCLEDYV